mmetsp:Transcript_92682/g.164787  ORF Transcript_92682/g.164787 Transcript_92682/m.164787 type:complete len:141 (-) Transcript_92682:102-524(-)
MQIATLALLVLVCAIIGLAVAYFVKAECTSEGHRVLQQRFAMPRESTRDASHMAREMSRDIANMAREASQGIANKQAFSRHMADSVAAAVAAGSKAAESARKASAEAKEEQREVRTGQSVPYKAMAPDGDPADYDEFHPL